MAKRTVIITMEIDTDEYDEIMDDPNECVELAEDILRGGADLPDNYTIECEGVKLCIVNGEEKD